MSYIIGIFVFSQISSFVPKILADSIPGTTLKTGVCYSIDMIDFSPGYMTWTTQPKLATSEKVQWYLQHVFKLSHETAAKYKKGGDWHESTLWQFIPSNKYSGWYKLRNGRFPDSYVTWSITDFVPWQRENTSNYVILERGRDEADYMLKPVFAEENKQGTTRYYQLTMRHFPQGKINWSRHTKSSHFIQNHHTAYPIEKLKKYDKGGGSYHDTLFIFTEMDGIFEDKEKFDICSASSSIEQRISSVSTKLYIALFYCKLKFYLTYLS